jgi:hypothetical protein
LGVSLRAGLSAVSFAIEVWTWEDVQESQKDAAPIPNAVLAKQEEQFSEEIPNPKIQFRVLQPFNDSSFSEDFYF